MVLSSAYRQSSEESEKGTLVDPENTLLWRMNRRRLEAEAIRDALLAVSGRLDGAVGGSLLQGGNRAYVLAVAEHGVRGAIGQSPGDDVGLSRPLGSAVGRDRRGRGLLRSGNPSVVPVERTAVEQLLHQEDAARGDRTRRVADPRRELEELGTAVADGAAVDR